MRCLSTEKACRRRGADAGRRCGWDSHRRRQGSEPERAELRLRLFEDMGVESIGAWGLQGVGELQLGSCPSEEAVRAGDPAIR